MKITAFTHIGDFGQEVERFELQADTAFPNVAAEDFTVENAFIDSSLLVPSLGVQRVEQAGNGLTLVVQPFRYCSDFSVKGKGAAEGIHFAKAEIDAVHTHTADDFEPHTENGVVYRLYRPKAASPRPLVLFLHGGGECGTDNMLQMTGSMGAANLAQRWPDMYVLAPQAPDGGEPLEELLLRMSQNKNRFDVKLGARTESGAGERGWNREYLTRVCDVIRELIWQGAVNARRVYVTGMSMGGAGVIRALSVAPELFAAAVPICPSMNGETYPMLTQLPQIPIWICAAYIDHQPNRHAYIFSACQKRWERGIGDTRLTIYTPDELGAYGIGVNEQLSMQQVLSENHSCWTLALHNEHGVLDWLISQSK